MRACRCRPPAGTLGVWRVSCAWRVIVALLLLALGARSARAQGTDDELKRRVDRGLAFLAAMQEKDGAWVAAGRPHPAVTALSVLAFLSAGHVPGEGPYREHVEKGVRRVLTWQRSDGLIAADEGHALYHHGVCTLMLAQVAGMTDTELARTVRPALAKAVAVLLKAQRPGPGAFAGGWRYRVDSPDADLSVSGWQLLALRAANDLGADVPVERIDAALDFVRRCHDHRSGGYCYVPGGPVTHACTGTAILALELRGGAAARGLEVARAGTYLLNHPLQDGAKHYYYAAYYGAHAMHRLGGNYWNVYRTGLQHRLFARQRRGGGWLGDDGFGSGYATAMALLALTVEYGFLPIHQRAGAADEPRR